MKTFFCSLALVVALQAQAATNLVGTWTGTLKSGGKEIQLPGASGTKLVLKKDGTYNMTSSSGKKSEGKWKLVKDTLTLTRKDPPKDYEPPVFKVAKNGKSFSMPVALNFGGYTRIAGSDKEVKSMEAALIFVREK